MPASLNQGSLPSPEKNPQRVNNNAYQAPQKPLEYAGVAGQGPYAPGNTVGLRLFPKLFEGGNTLLMHPIQSQSRVRFFPQNDNQYDPAAPGGVVVDAKPTTLAASVGTEMTVSVPRLVKDKKGNWVFNQWGATFGDMYQDTRFKEFYRGQPPTPRFRAPKELIQNYYPQVKPEERSTVCKFRSTLYNFPRVYDWLTPRIYRSVSITIRTVWLDLRKELFKEGDPLQCHTTTMTDWNKYIHCALMRNMRMEYLVPQYPLIQVSYHRFFRENIYFGN